MDSTRSVLVVSTDLMSSTRIVDTATAAGYAATLAETPGQLGQMAAALAVVDVAATPGSVMDAVAALRAVNPAVRIVAVYRHTDPDQARAARTAGCDLVLNRAQFFGDIGAALARLAGDTAAPAARPE